MKTECKHCEGNGYVEGHCGHCSGSGEGMHDGSHCRVCKGSGSAKEDCEKCDATGEVYDPDCECGAILTEQEYKDGDMCEKCKKELTV